MYGKEQVFVVKKLNISNVEEVSVEIEDDVDERLKEFNKKMKKKIVASLIRKSVGVNRKRELVVRGSDIP